MFRIRPITGDRPYAVTPRELCEAGPEGHAFEYRETIGNERESVEIYRCRHCGELDNRRSTK